MKESKRHGDLGNLKWCTRRVLILVLFAISFIFNISDHSVSAEEKTMKDDSQGLEGALNQILEDGRDAGLLVFKSGEVDAQHPAQWGSPEDVTEIGSPSNEHIGRDCEISLLSPDHREIYWGQIVNIQWFLQNELKRNSISCSYFNEYFRVIRDLFLNLKVSEKEFEIAEVLNVPQGLMEEIALQLAIAAILSGRMDVARNLRPIIASDPPRPESDFVNAGLNLDIGQTVESIKVLYKLSGKISEISQLSTVRFAEVVSADDVSLDPESWLNVLDMLSTIARLHAGTDFGAKAAIAEARLTGVLLGSDLAIQSLALSYERGLLRQQDLADAADLALSAEREADSLPLIELPVWYWDSDHPPSAFFHEEALANHLLARLRYPEDAGGYDSGADETSDEGAGSRSFPSGDWRSTVSDRGSGAVGDTQPVSQVPSRAEERGDVASSEHSRSVVADSKYDVSSDLVGAAMRLLRDVDGDLKDLRERLLQ